MSPTTLASLEEFEFQGFPPFMIRSPGCKSVTRASDTEIILQSKPLTDYWRSPPFRQESDAPADRESGALYYVNVKHDSDFTVGVWFRGYWGSQYDQGGLMVFAGDAEGQKYSWVKAGVEVDHGKEWTAAVVSSPYSDWSVALAPHSTSLGIEPNEARNEAAHWAYFRLVRSGPTLRVFHLFASKRYHIPEHSPDLIMLREVKGFNVDPERGQQLHSSSTWRVGVMNCGPKNQDGVTTEFADFHISVKRAS